MPIKLHTGAYGNPLPPYWTATKLHPVYVEYEAAENEPGQGGENDIPAPATFVYHDPVTCSLPEINIARILNILWQVKTFDLEVKWEFKEQDYWENANASYYPSRQGVHTEEGIYLNAYNNPYNNPNESPLFKSPMGPAVAGIYKHYTLYPSDKFLAREHVRSLFSYDFIPSHTLGPSRVFCNGKDFDAVKEQTLENFDKYFSDWTERVQANYEAFQNSTTPRGIKWKTDSQRQLEAIEPLKEYIKTKTLEPEIKFMSDKFLEDEDVDYQLAKRCFQLDYFLKELITREEDLELFDLYGGFDDNLDFFTWQAIRRQGAECHDVRHAFTAKPARLPCGFYYDETQTVPANKKLLMAKVLSTVLLGPTLKNLNLKLTYRKERQHIIVSRRGSFEFYLPRTSWVEFVLFNTAEKGNTFLGTEDNRAVSTNFLFDGVTHGGEYYHYTIDNQGTSVGTPYSYSTKFEDFFKTNGEALFPVTPTDLINYSESLVNNRDPECLGTAPANQYIYRSDFMDYEGQRYALDWQPPPLNEDGSPSCDAETQFPSTPVAVNFANTHAFFKDAIDTAAEYANVTQMEVGKFRIKTEADELLYETKIFGNWKIWNNFEITLTAKQYWFQS